MHLRKVECEVLYWIHQAQNNNQWRALLNQQYTFGSVTRWEFHE
jgi:hypothetical protein